MSNKVEDEVTSPGKKHDLTKEGPIKNRGCTDIICLLLFFAFIGGWIAVGIYGFQNGNPTTLIYPSDSNGIICGRGDKVEERPKLLFFDLTKCLKVSVNVAFGCPTKQVCVKECPDKLESFYIDLKKIESGLMTDENLNTKMEPYCDPKLFNKETPAKDLMEKQICPKWIVPSSSFLGRCVPFLKYGNGTEVFDGDQVLSADQTGNKDFTLEDLTNAVKKLLDVLNLRGYGEKVISDVVESWWAILLGVLLATFVSFVWVIMMRFVASVMVWSSIILSVALLGKKM